WAATRAGWLQAAPRPPLPAPSASRSSCRTASASFYCRRETASDAVGTLAVSRLRIINRMASTNHQAAKLFQEMADVLLLLNADRFKVAAFQKVAQALGTFPEDIAAIGPDEKKLRKIPGVGEG